PCVVPMLTAALIVVGWGVASAACLPDGEACRTDKKCCNPVCVKSSSSKNSFGTCNAMACCLQSSPMGAFDTCTVETPAQCFAQGGIAQGNGGQLCSPSPCPPQSTTTSSTSTSTTTSTTLGKCRCFWVGAGCPSSTCGLGSGCLAGFDCAGGECSAPPQPGCFPQSAVCVATCPCPVVPEAPRAGRRAGQRAGGPEGRIGCSPSSCPEPASSGSFAHH